MLKYIYNIIYIHLFIFTTEVGEKYFKIFYAYIEFDLI